MKSRVQIPSTHGAALHPGLALVQRETLSQRNKVASDTAGPGHPALTSCIHRPMQTQMCNYTTCTNVHACMYTMFSILNLLSALMFYEFKKKMFVGRFVFILKTLSFSQRLCPIGSRVSYITLKQCQPA